MDSWLNIKRFIIVPSTLWFAVISHFFGGGAESQLGVGAKPLSPFGAATEI
jgi:hypothetical protein